MPKRKWDTNQSENATENEAENEKQDPLSLPAQADPIVARLVEIISNLVQQSTSLITDIVKLVINYGDIQTHIHIPQEWGTDPDHMMDNNGHFMPDIRIRSLFSISIPPKMLCQAWNEEECGPHNHLCYDSGTVYCLDLVAYPYYYDQLKETATHSRSPRVTFLANRQSREHRFWASLLQPNADIDHLLSHDSVSPVTRIQQRKDHIRLGSDTERIKELVPPIQHVCTSDCTTFNMSCNNETKDRKTAWSEFTTNHNVYEPPPHGYKTKLRFYPEFIATKKEKQPILELKQLCRLMQYEEDSKIFIPTQYDAETHNTEEKVSTVEEAPEIQFIRQLLDPQLIVTIAIPKEPMIMVDVINVPKEPLITVDVLNECFADDSLAYTLNRYYQEKKMLDINQILEPWPPLIVYTAWLQQLRRHCLFPIEFR